LNAYKQIGIGSENVYLTDGKTIHWNNMRRLVSFLAEREEEYFKNEMKKRDKREKFQIHCNTDEDKIRQFQALPNYDRDLEKYIQPFQEGWQQRYYKALFDIDDIYCAENKGKLSDICVNYLEMLEWTLEYYNNGCKDWRWCYRYAYPPLLKDLLQYIPVFERKFLQEKKENPVSDLVQLCYVLPRTSLYLLPEKIKERLVNEYGGWYPRDTEFLWSFCKYFWEAHAIMPPIDINKLETIVKETTAK
jgi:5'-3' exonuclease